MTRCLRLCKYSTMTSPMYSSLNPSTKRSPRAWLIYVAIGAVALLIGMAIAGQSAEAPESVPVAPAEQPVEAPRQPASDPGQFSYCGVSGPGITPDTELSHLHPNNYGIGSDYCEGFEYVYFNYAEFPGVCTEFWALPDEDVVAAFMARDGGSHTFDRAVGMTDALWVVC